MTGVVSLLALASALGAASESTQPFGLRHTPPSCVTAGRFPRLEAMRLPASPVVGGRVYFRAEWERDWYFVDAEVESGTYRALLPSPARRARGLHYRLETTDLRGGTQSGPTYVVDVVDAWRCPDGAPPAPSVEQATILLGVPQGAPASPPGFESKGLITAQDAEPPEWTAQILVGQLGDIDGRPIAVQRLIRLGPAAIPALTDAIRSSAPEMRDAATSVLLRIPGGFGLLSCRVRPWAEIQVDGVSSGTTPLAPLRLVAGPHVVIARHPSHGSIERQVLVVPGATQQLDLDLRPPEMARAPSDLPASARTESSLVETGVQQVEAGDLPQGLATLTQAANALKAPEKNGLRARAYLYLGIAYLANDEPLAAATYFRWAKWLAPDLRLTPDELSPRVIEAFQGATPPQRPPGAAK